MSTDKSATWSYAEGLPEDDQVLARARERAYELGVATISTGVAAALTAIAASAGARNAVEVGTGAGVSGVSLLRGLGMHAVLTTIDNDVEHLRAARLAFAEAGFAANRTRTIAGRALDVLPRLTDSAYDLVFLDADKAGIQDYVGQALRLLKPGGSLLINDALDRGRVANPANREPVTAAMRGALRQLRDDETLTTALFPTGDGLFLAVRQR